MTPSGETPQKPPEISKIVNERPKDAGVGLDENVKRGAGILGALLLLCVILAKVMSPAKDSGDVKRLFEERRPDLPDADKRPPKSSLLGWLWNDTPADTPAASLVGAPKSQEGSGAWKAAIAAASAKKDKEAIPFSAPKLGGGLSGMGSGGSGGSSGASYSVPRNDNVFHGEGSTGLIPGNLKTAAARVGGRPGPAVSGETLKNFGGRQSDALQSTRSDALALNPGGVKDPAGGGGPGPEKADQGPGGAPPGDEKGNAPMPDAHKPSDSGDKPAGGAPGGGAPGGGKPGKNCQDLQAQNAPEPANGKAAEPAKRQAGISLCAANSELAAHQQLKNGEQDSADSAACAASCNQGGTPGASPASAKTGQTTQNEKKGYDKLVQEAKDDTKKLADRAKQECIEPNSRAEQAIKKIDTTSANMSLGQGASLDGELQFPETAEPAAQQQQQHKTQASNSTSAWDRQVDSASQQHATASNACRKLASDSEIKPIEDKFKAAQKLLDEDRQRLEKARALRNAPAGDVNIAAATSGIQSRSDDEHQRARNSYDEGKRRFDTLKNDLKTGRIDRYNQKIDGYVQDAKTRVRQGKDVINNVAQAGSPGTFGDAQGKVGSVISPLYQANNGVDTARQAAQEAR